jgi:hypothetical protein
VHEEAMLAVGAFMYACGRQFNKYLPAFYPYLKIGLMNHQEWQVRQLLHPAMQGQLPAIPANYTQGLASMRRYMSATVPNLCSSVCRQAVLSSSPDAAM